MATTKKGKTSNRKSSTQKTVRSRTQTRVKTENEKREGESLTTDILFLVVLAFCVLLFLANLGLAGSWGNAISGLFKGLFGIMAYPFPVVLFFGFALALANKENRHIVRGIVSAILLFVFLSAFFQLILAGYKEDTPIRMYYSAAKDGSIAGGLIGGLIVLFFAKPFGIVGAYVCVLAGLIISLILLTEKPLMSYMRRRSASALKDAGDKRKERRAQRAELRKQELAEREASREKEREEQSRAASAGRAANGRNAEARKKQPKDARDDRNYDFDFGIIGVSGTPGTSDAEEEPAPKKEKSRAGRSGTIRKEDVSSLAIPEGFSEAETKELFRDPPDAAMGRTMQNVSSGDGTPKRRRTKKDNGEAEDVSIDLDTKEAAGYTLPDISLLTDSGEEHGDSEEHIRETAKKLQQTLADFGVNVTITNVSCGPAVTRYELQPEHGVKVSRIVNLTDDIKLGLAAADIRIEAPIPGKAAVGIEVPNAENTTVTLRGMLKTPEFRNFKSKLAFAVGRDLAGKPVISDIKKMPHLLIAGATGSGKSVCINTLIMSVLFKATPEEVRMIMIDPKVIELSIYNGIPHLLLPVVTDPKKAAGALSWAVSEMERRYRAFAEIGVGVRDLASYNMHVRKKKNDPELSEEEKEKYKELPQILIIVDELADLMMVAPGEVEQSICRITQLARAAGLHLIVATQRPSVNVITGLIKANMPSRIAFAVSSGVDSRTIIDMVGAERLLGKGDMLFYPQGYQKPVRVQGSFVSDEDVAVVVDSIKAQNGETSYSDEVKKEIEESTIQGSTQNASKEQEDDGRDEYFWEAGQFIIEKEKASIGMLQRVYKIGFNRAARIMDQLCEAGVVAGEEGTKPRRILMTLAEFEALQNGDGDDDEVPFEEDE